MQRGVRDGFRLAQQRLQALHLCRAAVEHPEADGASSSVSTPPFSPLSNSITHIRESNQHTRCHLLEQSRHLLDANVFLDMEAILVAILIRIAWARECRSLRTVVVRTLLARSSDRRIPRAADHRIDGLLGSTHPALAKPSSNREQPVAGVETVKLSRCNIRSGTSTSRLGLP